MKLLGSERNEPLYFAGRHEELGALRKRVEYLLNRPDDTGGGMVLIDGTQGIGKTQLALEFARRTCADNPHVLHVAKTTQWLATDPDRLVEELTKQLPARAHSTAHLFDQAKRHFRQLLFRIQLQKREGTVESLLAETKERGWWHGHALILTIDEVQSVTAEARSTLKVLHEGSHGCPILLVGMGLQHAAQVLASDMTNRDGTSNRDAISRFGNRLTLSTLSVEESIEAVQRGVEAAGAGKVPRSLAEAIADESKGFPQHIHGYLGGCLDALEKHDSLDSEPAQRVALEAGREARRQYYESRLRSMRDECQAGILALALALPPEASPLADIEAERILDEAGAKRGVTGRETMQEAIEKGVLTRLLGGTVAFPIPSFHDYAAALAQTSAQRA